MEISKTIAKSVLNQYKGKAEILPNKYLIFSSNKSIVLGPKIFDLIDDDLLESIPKCVVKIEYDYENQPDIQVHVMNLVRYFDGRDDYYVFNFPEAGVLMLTIN